jgi:hypothetical protein
MRHSLLAGMIVIAGAAAAASAQNFDFSEFAASDFDAGDRTTLSSTRDGLTMTLERSSGTTFSVTDLSVFGAPASWGSRSLSAFQPQDGFTDDLFVASFSSPLTFASIQFGDYGADSDTPVILTAWSGPNGTGSIVGSVTETWVDGRNIETGDFGTATVATTTPFASITLKSSTDFPQSLFWDNLTVEVVPAPAASLAFGMLGLTAARRRRA